MHFSKAMGKKAAAAAKAQLEAAKRAEEEKNARGDV